MSGLRLKHRQEREAAIVRAALGLIAERGYRNTTVEAIASAAEIGPVTFYNYFGSKAGFLIALVTRRCEAILARGETAIAGSYPDPEQAILALLKAYLGDILEKYDSRLLRELLAAIFIEQLTVRQKMLEIDYRFISQLTTLLGKFKDRGQLNPVVPVEEAAAHLYITVSSWLMVLIVDDEITPAAFLRNVRRHLHIAFNGIGAGGRPK